KPFLLEAHEFAHYVDAGFFQKRTTPAYKKGDTFIHQYNNNTVEVIDVSPMPSESGYIYFVVLVESNGYFYYSTVDENYLANCIKREDTGEELTLPEIKNTKFYEFEYVPD